MYSYCILTNIGIKIVCFQPRVNQCIDYTWGLRNPGYRLHQGPDHTMVHIAPAYRVHQGLESTKVKSPAGPEYTSIQTKTA